jgi:hypothetical protein
MRLLCRMSAVFLLSACYMQQVAPQCVVLPQSLRMRLAQWVPRISAVLALSIAACSKYSTAVK